MIDGLSEEYWPWETLGMGIIAASLAIRQIGFMFSDSDGLDYIAGLVREKGLPAYERPLPDLLAWLASQSTGLMLDVGANTGLFSLLTAAANPLIKVCSFEPLESIARILSSNIALNPHFAHRIKVYPFGLSDAAGAFDFYETINDHGLLTTSSSLEINHAKMIGSYRKQTVVTETLDKWSLRLAGSKISLIKIDVEGHEYAVISGGRETIARDRPLITVEVLPTSRIDAINELLFEANYLDFALTPEALRLCTTIRHHPEGWNHLLCPAEQAALLLGACRELNLLVEFS
jgi:FkbM family methyltransferase